jgi:hypothetical protein
MRPVCHVRSVVAELAVGSSYTRMSGRDELLPQSHYVAALALKGVAEHAVSAVTPSEREAVIHPSPGMGL